MKPNRICSSSSGKTISSLLPIICTLGLLFCIAQHTNAIDPVTTTIDTVRPDITYSNPPCPPGKDTTLVICPFKGYAPDLLQINGLPMDGVWEPPLQQPAWEGYYNSCVDSSSVYIYTTSVPECPDVRDTVHFDLRWSPPCNWEYEACFTSDRYDITIPAYPEFNGDSYEINCYLAAGNPGVFNWTPCGYWSLHPDSTNTITCEPGWDNDAYMSHCVDVRLHEPVTGCEWYFPPFDYGYEYWDCGLLPCEVVAADEAPEFRPINVYPVPANDILIIDLDNPITEVTLSGPDGRLYRTITNPGSNIIDVSDLGPGWYHLRIYDGQAWYQARMVK